MGTGLGHQIKVVVHVHLGGIAGGGQRHLGLAAPAFKAQHTPPVDPAPALGFRLRKQGAAQRAHDPAFQPHPIQGWTPDFIPFVLQEAIDGGYWDDMVPVAGADGIKWSKRLAAEEGIFTGISGGSTFAVAMKVAETAPEGSTILVMLPDTGERYLSTPLFEGIPEDMTEEEMAISLSTPTAQMAAE